MTGWKQAGIVVLLFLASILVGILIPNWPGIKFTVPDQVLISLGIFIVSILLDLIFLTQHMAAIKEFSRKRWLIEKEADQEISNIRDCFSEIVRKRYGEKDLFVSNFRRKMTELAADIYKASHQGELFLDSRHFASAGEVMESFLGEKCPLHRSVWMLEPGEKLFGIHADLEYFRLLLEAAQKRKIKGVKTLCVLQDMADIKDSRIAAFLDFYTTNKRFECKIVLNADYQRFGLDEKLSGDFEDFGIYGTRQLFLTKTYSPDRSGLFVRDERRVSLYINFFDKVWGSKAVRSNPSNARNGVTIDDLIAIDGT